MSESKEEIKIEALLHEKLDQIFKTEKTVLDVYRYKYSLFNILLVYVNGIRKARGAPVYELTSVEKKV